MATLGPESRSLPLPDLCRRVAEHLNEQALAAARHAYHLSDRKARSAELARLAASKSLTERMAADLVRRWDSQP